MNEASHAVRRKRVPRVVVVVGLFLGSGAATTIAVAWVAVFLAGKPSSLGQGAAIVDDVLVGVTEAPAFGRVSHHWRIDDLRGTSILSESARREAAKVRELGAFRAAEENRVFVEDLMRQMGRSVPTLPPLRAADHVAACGPRTPYDRAHLPNGGLLILESFFGWPLPALGVVNIVRSHIGDATGIGKPPIEQETEWRGAFWLWGRQAAATPGPKVSAALLPLIPLWPGFVVDTLLFGTVWTLPFVVGPRFRRSHRRRRGHCPRCAYDLRHDFAAGCPECGWNRVDSAPRGW